MPSDPARSDFDEQRQGEDKPVTGRYDVILVGGGHNGLVAAGYLARRGLKVLVLERRAVVGGPCSPLEFFPGYWGAFTNSPGSLEPKIVQELELERFGLEFRKPDPSVVQPFDDGRCFAAWREPARLADMLREFSAHDAKAYYEFFNYLNAFARRLRISLFERPPRLSELTSRLETWEDEEAFGKIVLGSVRDLLDEWFESEEIKATIAILGVMSTLAGPSTPGTSLMLLLRPLSLASVATNGTYDPRMQPMRGSTGLPVGGMGSITRAMRRSIESAGGTVRTDAEVARVLVRDGGVTGVVLGTGEAYEAGVVVSNVDPKTTLLKLIEPGHLDSRFRERVGHLKMRGSQFKVALALDGLPRFAGARNDEEAQAFASCQFRIAPSMDYMERAWDDAKYGRWSDRAMMWGLTPSVMDPALAPTRKHIMSVNIYHAPYELRDGEWATERDRFGKRCIDVLSAYVPNLKDIITDYRFWSPRDIEDELRLPEANITHGDLLPGRMFSLRPLAGWSDYRTPIRGLYLCGSGTWPTGFVSGIPGHNASQQVLRDLAAGLERVHAAVLSEREA
jgi:phytoene dehydrogenase-like protein